LRPQGPGPRSLPLGGHGKAGCRARPGDARRILDERLARGEIDTEEYQRLREVLEGGPGRTAGSGSAR
jgi:hypothetical protein